MTSRRASTASRAAMRAAMEQPTIRTGQASLASWRTRSSWTGDTPCRSCCDPRIWVALLAAEAPRSLPGTDELLGLPLVIDRRRPHEQLHQTRPQADHRAEHRVAHSPRVTVDAEVEMQEQPERLRGAIEIAQFLDVPVSSLYQWRYRGDGPRGRRPPPDHRLTSDLPTGVATLFVLRVGWKAHRCLPCRRTASVPAAKGPLERETPRR